MANPTDPFSASIIPFEVPEQMRAFAEKGVSQARDSYAKFKDVAETNNGTIEAVFTTASKGYSEYSAKLMEMMKANTTATLDFAQELLAVKSPSEAMELWTSHARKQYEALTAQAKELAELTQKVATETVEPIKANASKLFKPAACSHLNPEKARAVRPGFLLWVSCGRDVLALPKTGVAPSFRPVR
jgi:phasin